MLVVVCIWCTAAGPRRD
uniref:Uncharacterized protein n=1 Tax=Arundo donax TaxID=35708 RepID=A0A0A9G4U4_ARUDO